MTYQRILDAYEYLKERVKYRIDLAVVLGSGLGDYADSFEEVQVFPYAEIPGFPVSTAPGHKGRLVIGKKHGKIVAALQGRFHCYEGYHADETVIPLRTLFKLGAKGAILTNAVGGINRTFQAGDLVAVTDHINFASRTPLLGANLDEFGPRFPDMTYAYDRDWIALLEDCARQNNIGLKKGIYAMMLGPSYETPAEIRALGVLGADLVGMSTVPEVIACAHAGIRCVVVSCVTNMAAGILDQPLSHEEVMAAGQMVRDKFTCLLDSFIRKCAL